MAQRVISRHVTLRLTRESCWGSQPHPLPRAGGSEATPAPLRAGLVTRDELDQRGCPSLGFSVALSSAQRCPHHTPGAGGGWGDCPWWFPKPAQGFGGAGDTFITDWEKGRDVMQTPRGTQPPPWGTRVTWSHLPGVTAAPDPGGSVLPSTPHHPN